ncbi:MAG: thermonuclease family protein [Rhodospirillales bacterium]|nr:thermonuclease family protein [Rhodospirillales bacterium]
MSARAQEEAADIPLPQGDFTGLRLMDNTAVVDQIIDPLRMRTKKGEIIQLSSLDVPELNLPEPGAHALAALTFLKDNLEGQQVTIYQTMDKDKGRQNRMGHGLAHLARKEGDVWIQGAMLANGLARVLPSARNTEMAAQMLALEEKARTEKRGLWADERYAVLTPDTAMKAADGWAVVEGRVLKTAMMRNNVYLNFGDDWRSDFTIVLNSDVRRQMSKSNIDPLQFGGKRVRVHGWLEDYNGPSIVLSDSAWLEVLPEEEN